MEKLVRETERRQPTAPDPGLSEPLPDALWDALLADLRTAGKPPLPIHQRRLSEIPRHVLRVECVRCLRIVEIQKLDALKYYGPHTVWKDVGQRLLDQPCASRTGRHEEDGCWSDWRA
jgi:hypothetical protein